MGQASAVPAPQYVAHFLASGVGASLGQRSSRQRLRVSARISLLARRTVTHDFGTRQDLVWDACVRPLVSELGAGGVSRLQVDETSPASCARNRHSWTKLVSPERSPVAALVDGEGRESESGAQTGSMIAPAMFRCDWSKVGWRSTWPFASRERWNLSLHPASLQHGSGESPKYIWRMAPCSFRKNGCCATQAWCTMLDHKLMLKELHRKGLPLALLFVHSELRQFLEASLEGMWRRQRLPFSKTPAAHQARLEGKAFEASLSANTNEWG